MTPFEQLDPSLSDSRMPKFLGYVLVILLLILKSPGFLFLSGESPDENANEYINRSDLSVITKRSINGKGEVKGSM